jgi:membrane-bound ClpP family serine protease
VATLVGMPATVITPIPANGVGEIAYVQAGTRYSAPARDERGAPVANGQTVKIVRIVGTQFYVAPI